MSKATIEQCTVALFNRAPMIGEINPKGEISYVGYKRVLIAVHDGTNLNGVDFPPSEQDEPVFVSHAVAMDGVGRVVGVRPL